MKTAIFDNVPVQDMRKINSKPITYKRGAIIRAKIESINSDGVSIKLANGQILSARIDGQWTFEVGSSVDFQVLEWTLHMAKLKLFDMSMSLRTDQIDQYMERLGLARTTENEAILYYMLLRGIPLNKDNVSFYMKKHFKLSLRIQMLLQIAMREGMTEDVKNLEDLLPRLETLVNFIKDLSSNLENIHKRIVYLCEKLMEKDKNEDMRIFVGELFKGILLQMDENLPVQMVQLPIKINGRLSGSEMWIDRECNTFYMEIDLPRLGTTGCLLEGWRSEVSLTFYCQPAYHFIIKNEMGPLRQALKDVGVRVERLAVHSSLEEYGLTKFLKRYRNEQESIDIKA